MKERGLPIAFHLGPFVVFIKDLVKLVCGEAQTGKTGSAGVYACRTCTAFRACINKGPSGAAALAVFTASALAVFAFPPKKRAPADAWCGCTLPNRHRSRGAWSQSGGAQGRARDIPLQSGVPGSLDAGVSSSQSSQSSSHSSPSGPHSSHPATIDACASAHCAARMCSCAFASSCSRVLSSSHCPPCSSACILSCGAAPAALAAAVSIAASYPCRPSVPRPRTLIRTQTPPGRRLCVPPPATGFYSQNSCPRN